MLRTPSSSSKHRQRSFGSPSSSTRHRSGQNGSPRRNAYPDESDMLTSERQSPSRSPDRDSVKARMREYLPTGDNLRYLVREYQYDDGSARNQRSEHVRGNSSTDSRKRSPDRRQRDRSKSRGHESPARAARTGLKSHSRSRTGGREDYLGRLLAALEEACRNAVNVNLLTVKMKENLQLDIDRAANTSSPQFKNTRFV